MIIPQRQPWTNELHLVGQRCFARLPLQSHGFICNPLAEARRLHIPALPTQLVIGWCVQPGFPSPSLLLAA